MAGYSRFDNMGYDQIVVSHVRGFASGIRATNYIESFWAKLMRVGN